MLPCKSILETNFRVRMDDGSLKVSGNLLLQKQDISVGIYVFQLDHLGLLWLPCPTLPSPSSNQGWNEICSRCGYGRSQSFGCFDDLEVLSCRCSIWWRKSWYHYWFQKIFRQRNGKSHPPIHPKIEQTRFPRSSYRCSSSRYVYRYVSQYICKLLKHL